MHSSVQTLARAWLTTAVTVGCLALAGPALAAQGGQSAQGYAGEKTCLTCHEAQIKGYHGSAHSRAWNPRTPSAGQGCESCHGPGAAHVDGGGDKSKIKTYKTMTPREISDSCLTCHARGERATWNGSQHDTRSMSCITCHSIHGPKSETGQLKTVTQVETCQQCHRGEVQKVNKSAHMPVREGKMVCSSCHNPHGTTNVKLLKVGNSVNEACTSCHTEKRGPFLFEHAAVVENCTSCHDSHGSNNERMLVAKQPFLCQRCHVTTRHPPTIYDNFLLKTSTNSNKIYGRSCVVCHQNIHGSNSPSGKAFLR
jgi:DmsE family decaheme c-type cytochrome